MPALPDYVTPLKPGESTALRPVFSVPAGYPSPAQDYVEQQLDLNNYLLGDHRASVFFFRLGGDSMEGAGLRDGDIVIVDRAVDPDDGSIVVASVYGEFTCKYYRKLRGKVYLEPANPAYKVTTVTEEMEMQVFGTYIGHVHKAKERNTDPFVPPVE